MSLQITILELFYQVNEHKLKLKFGRQIVHCTAKETISQGIKGIGQMRKANLSRKLLDLAFYTRWALL